VDWEGTIITRGQGGRVQHRAGALYHGMGLSAAYLACHCPGGSGMPMIVLFGLDILALF